MGPDDTQQLYCSICDYALEGFEGPYAQEHMQEHVTISDGVNKNSLLVLHKVTEAN